MVRLERDLVLLFILLVVVGDFFGEALFFVPGLEVLLVQVPSERRLDDEIADDGEEAGDADGGADQEHEDADEGDHRIEEGEVAEDV